MAHQYNNIGNHQESLNFCLKLTKKGEPEGYLISGQNYYDMGQYKESLQCYESGIGKTNGEAEFWLAIICEKKLKKPNLEKALLFYQQSANQGKPISCLILGEINYLGESNITKNLDISEKWFLRAIELVESPQENFTVINSSYYLGLINKERGDLEKAKIYFEMTLQVGGDHKGAKVELDMINARSNKLSD